MWSRSASSIPRTAAGILCKSSQSPAQNVMPVRCLNLQEYRSKEILDKHGVTVQRFIVADSAADAKEKFKNFKAREYVVKAQVLAGGRGKGHFLKSGLKGGVKLTTKQDEAVEWIDKMIGYNLVTKQTPAEGVKVKNVMVAESVDIKRECYVAILMDRAYNGPVIVASTEGGMDIEEVAETKPDAIHKVPVDIIEGLSDATALQLAKDLNFKGDLLQTAADQIKKLYELFLSVDATQIEINPFSETECNRVFCIDAKLNFDDSAAFRQKEIFAMGDDSESDPREVEATKHNLNYVGMDGNIACLVNGAGLAMATMDIIKLHGGNPANFLDVGGTVGEEQVFHAFRIITQDTQVQAILVNIFGGIVNCATIARGLTGAFKRMQLNVPLVVRFEGTNVEEARRILEESNLPMITATDLDDAGKKAVAAVSK